MSINLRLKNKIYL
jgi:hypothetical protein